MTPPQEPRGNLGTLFAPGERLGWIFRDRLRFLRSYPEPPPALHEPPADLLRRHQVAQANLLKRALKSVGVGLGFAILFACFGACASQLDSDGGAGGGPFATLMLVLAFVAFMGGFVGAALMWARAQTTSRDLVRAEHDARERLASDERAWHQRRTAFQVAERRRVDSMIEWGAATTPPNTRRIDVVGGTLWGWESFITTFGTSMMGTRGSLLVLDLSGEAVSAELVRLADRAGAGVDLQRLPGDLEDSDLLVGLSTEQFVDALVEAMHGDRQADSRDDRSMDRRLLSTICAVIEPDLTMARLAAAVHTVMGEPGIQEGLTEDERTDLIDMFSDEYRRQAHANLRRIDSYIHPLRELGARRRAREEAFLSVLSVDSDGRNVRSDLLTDLLVQWVTRRMLSPSAPRTLIIAGGDDLQRRHIERLSDICERRDIRLVFLFRHLRDASLHVLGSGAVAFMRLGNHEEATRAADFIGRQHTFVLSQLTRTLGGNDTHGESDTEGYSESESLSLGDSFSRASNWSQGKTLLDSTRSGGVTRSDSRTQGWTTSRNWSKTRNWSEGTNWSDASTEQRVYEYTVEPRVLQHLPDHAMLLVESHQDGPRLHAVEVDPSIITLPRASHEPLPEVMPPPQIALPSAPATDAQVALPNQEPHRAIGPGSPLFPADLIGQPAPATAVDQPASRPASGVPRFQPPDGEPPRQRPGWGP